MPQIKTAKVVTQAYEPPSNLKKVEDTTSDYDMHSRFRMPSFDLNCAIRNSTAFVVVTVTIFAAIVSYSHIYYLGHTHGQDGTAARLLPLSVDGLILASGLIMLYEARNGRDAPTLARVMSWLGVAATLAANALFGWHFGIAGTAISMWPAISFIGCVEMIMRQIRNVAQRQENTEDFPTGPCIDGREHEPYNVKPGTQVTKCRKCRVSMRVAA